jgi:Resolvase, N terminal domain
MEHPMRVALYARVSTANSQDPEMQLRELREYAVRRGWEIVSEYIDHGVSLKCLALAGPAAADTGELGELRRSGGNQYFLARR